MPTVPVDLSTAASHTLVAAPTGTQFIRVKGWVLMANANVNVQFRDGDGNAVFGTLYLGERDSVAVAVPAGGAGGYFDLPKGKALVLNLASAVAVGGGVIYELMGLAPTN